MKSNAVFKFALLRSLFRQSSRTQQGFTLIEVLVAVVILSIFVLAALSALVIGLNGKQKAKLNNEATLIIEQDLESVRYKSTFGLATVSGTPTVGTISGTSVTLTIPINTTNYLYTGASAAGTSLTAFKLSIGFEKSAYTLTTVPSATSPSVAVTLNASNITAPATTLNTALVANTTITSIATATDATSRIKVGDRIVIGPSSSSNVFSVIVTGITGSTGTPPLTISFASSTPANAYAAETNVIVLPRSGDIIVDPNICPDATTTPARTIASQFLISLGNSTNNVTTKSVPFNGRTYQLTRTATNLNPIVRLDYSVIDPTVSTSTTNSLATLTTQVIPNVASQCP